jgi:hypothetical protein
MPELPTNEGGEEVPIDPRVTRELFLEWRSPRFGIANPDRLEEELGRAPDLELFARRYRPPLPHEVLPVNEDEGPEICRITVDGVVVRYVEDSWDVQLTVEGDLPEPTLTTLVTDLTEKLSELENTKCEFIRL